VKTERTEIDPPAPDPCQACPWLTKNHGKRHPEKYYSDANRRRLWGGMRTGDAPGMTCHPTDPENQPIRDDVRTRECTGAWILLMREQQALEGALRDGGTFVTYAKGRRLALTREGFFVLMGAILPPPLGRGLQGTTLNNEADVSIGLGTDR
jgi:hypothetical protein